MCRGRLVGEWCVFVSVCFCVCMCMCVCVCVRVCAVCLLNYWDWTCGDIIMRARLNVDKITSKINEKLCDFYPKNIQKHFKIHQKTIPNRSKCILGAFSAPSRDQVGIGVLPSIKGLHHLEPAGSKVLFKCVFLDARGSKMIPKSNF